MATEERNIVREKIKAAYEQRMKTQKMQTPATATETAPPEAAKPLPPARQPTKFREMLGFTATAPVKASSTPATPAVATAPLPATIPAPQAQEEGSGYILLEDAKKRVDRILHEGRMIDGGRNPLTVTGRDKPKLFEYIINKIPTSPLEQRDTRHWLKAFRTSLGIQATTASTNIGLDAETWGRLENTGWINKDFIQRIVSHQKKLGLELSKEQIEKLDAFGEALENRKPIYNKNKVIAVDATPMNLEEAKSAVNFILTIGKEPDPVRPIIEAVKPELLAYIFEKMPKSSDTETKPINKDKVLEESHRWLKALRLSTGKDAAKASRAIELAASAWHSNENTIWPSNRFITALTEHFKDLTGVALTAQQGKQLDELNSFLGNYRGAASTRTPKSSSPCYR